MIPLAWMAGAGIGSWLLLTAAGGSQVHPEALYGMLGPLVSVSATWLAMARTHRRSPERLTAVMMAGFALKMVFFGAYVAVMLRWLDLRQLPFVLSFTGFFIALYAMEAFFLRRLTVAAAPRQRAV